jgi:ADP-dependent NAD(P)H-hydrate dehydratase
VPPADGREARAVDITVLAEHQPPDFVDAGDKRDRGQVVVIGGDPETPGGGMLAAIGALRAGAGRAHVIADESATASMAVAHPELRVSALPQHARLQAAPKLVESIERADVIVVGSGCTDAERASSVVVQVAPLVSPAAMLIIDAAGLAAVAERPELLGDLGDRAVLLPNPTEAARLLHQPDDAVSDDLERATRTAVERFGTTVAVRGATTYVAGPGHGPFFDERGHAALGTSGSGDVLIGMVAGLAARGATPIGAVLWGVRAHGLAGEALAAEHGGLGLLARELLDHVAPELNRMTAAARGQARASASQSMAASQV